ncbi:MAG: hypothetical protein AAFR34_07425 [Pseudomonadota bacterium]
MRPAHDPHARWVLIYRWIVFLLAAAAVIRHVMIAGDYGNPGGPFRFLTNWALLLSFFVASRMLALTERRSDRHWPQLVAATAVVNAMMVYLYWSLRLTDPALVQSGPAIPVYLDYYLHLIGPVLMWVDAFFIQDAFRRPWRSLPLLLGIVALYVVWIEAFVAPFNIAPFGSVTSGLPYPFLNDLELAGRLAFYGQTTLGAMVVLAGMAGLAVVIRRRG